MLTEQQLDDLYTGLCHSLTEVGIGRTPMVLARLVLLLMHELDDAAAIERAIAAALAGAEPASAQGGAV